MTDLLFERAMQFAKHKRPSHGLSNLYVIQTIDQDGNVTNETYGMNTFTNHGFEQFFNSNQTWPRNIYIGQGADADNPGFLTVPQLIDPLTTACDNTELRNTVIDYRYPLYYDSNNGIITCVCKFQTSVFGNSTDYGVDGISTDVSISEYGIGTAWNALWTHSWVYDITGARCTVTKHLNEQLRIVVYLCMAFNESLITSGWANNRYMVITTLQKFLETRSTDGKNMTETSAGIVKRNNVIGPVNRIFSRSLYTNNQITLHTTLSDFNMNNQHGDVQGYLDGFYNYTPGFVIVEPQVRSIPESFDIVMQNRYNNFHATSMADYIGEDDATEGHKAPFTQMDLQHVYLYNKSARSYNNPISFTNSIDHWYDEIGMENKLRVPIYYTQRDEYIEAFVHQNLRTDDAILGFDNAGISMLYGTNKYWDRSTWIEITTRSTIPQNVRNMRYYITSNSVESLKPIRESGEVTLTPSTGRDVTLASNITSPGEYTYESCANATRGYFVRNNIARVITNGTTFTIGSNTGTPLNDGYNANAHFCYGNRVVSVDSRSAYFVTNFDDLLNPYSVIVSTVGADGFGDVATNMLTQTYRTETSNGTLCFHALNQNKSLVVDTTRRSSTSENSLYHIPLDAYLSCAIYSTHNENYVAYISTDETPKLKVLDVGTETVYRTIDLPTNTVHTTATLMFGLNGYVWITNCSTYCYRFDINMQTYVDCAMDRFTLVQNKTDLQYVKLTAVEDVMVLYKTNTYSLQYGYYVRIDENLQTPVVYNLTDFYAVTDYEGYQMTYTLEYVEGNTLILLVQCGKSRSGYTIGCTRHVIDLGQWLNPPPDAAGRVKKDLYRSEYNEAAWYPYGKNVIWENKIIPMAYLLPMRFVGTTKTHTTVNDIKHITNKQWSIRVSNVAPTNYGENGFPPGHQI